MKNKISLITEFAIFLILSATSVQAATYYTNSQMSQQKDLYYLNLNNDKPIQMYYPHYPSYYPSQYSHQQKITYADFYSQSNSNSPNKIPSFYDSPLSSSDYWTW